MQSGKMLVADHQGTYVVKLVGDVRLTLCNTIDDYLDFMFTREDFQSVIIDVSDVDGIDSTSLGLLAKFAIQAKKRLYNKPTIISPNINITRLLESMGFHKVFHICDKLVSDAAGLRELALKPGDEECVRCKVLEAHRCLMDMSESNKDKFSDLVTALEAAKTD